MTFSTKNIDDLVPHPWKVSITNLFTTITRSDTCLIIDNEDGARVRDRVKEAFGYVFEGYYYFDSDDVIEKIFAKQLLMRDRK